MLKESESLFCYAVSEFGEPLVPLRMPMPEPKGTEVLLKVDAAGVCHSDLHICHGFYDLGGGKRLLMGDRGIRLPVIMGHEICGTVVSAGPEAEGVTTGVRKLAFPWIGCGSCETCARGEEHYCLSPRFLGIFRPGGYASHVLVPHPRYLLDIGAMEPAIAAPFACSGLTAYSALRKIPESVLKSEPIVLFGAGGVGLMCLTLLGMLGARGAIVVDIDATKRATALELGALAAFDGQDPNLVDSIKAASATGKGVRAAIDFVGVPSTVQTGFDSLMKGGTQVIVGLIGGAISLSIPLIASRAIAIQGSYVGSLAELDELMQLVRRRPPEPLPARRRTLAEANAALAELEAGRVIGRTILCP